MTPHKNTTHGHAGRGRLSATYKTWKAMRHRCTNPRHISYPNYGGRGIAVDPAWGAYETFLADMGEKPAGMSLDRIDNNRGYSKANCRWAPRSVQNRNRRNVRWIHIEGMTLTMSDWAAVFGVNVVTACGRIRSGWAPAVAVSTLPQFNRATRHVSPMTLATK